MIKIDTVEQAEEFKAKTLIMNIINETTFETRTEMRNTKWFRDRYEHWHSSKVRHASKIGSLMKLIDEAKPKTQEEWIEYYFKKFTNYNDFKRLVEQAQSVLGLSIKATVIFLWVKTLDYSWEGYNAENVALAKLRKAHPNKVIQRASAYDDNHYNIDFHVYDLMTGERIGAVQVKGVGYFIGRKAEGRMNGHKKGYTEFFRKTGIRIQYLLKEDEGVNLFPVECFGDEQPVDYKSIIPSIIPSIRPHTIMMK